MDGASPAGERIRTAEVIAALSLATDLGTGLPFEHGLRSTLVAMRIAERLGADATVASQTYYACLLFYVGCTADAEVAAELFDGDIHEHLTPVMFGSRGEIVRALSRAVASPGRPPALRAARIATRLPRALRIHPRHLAAACEVGRMLTVRLGLPAPVPGLFGSFAERFDGKGWPGRAGGEEIPLPVRIAHVAREAAFQQALGGDAHAVAVVGEHSGGALDPAVAAVVVEEAPEVLAADAGGSAWEAVLDAEPGPRLELEGDAIDGALAAIGDFADLACPFLAGHSGGVGVLAGAAAGRCGLDPAPVRRAGHLHDVGRVGVPAGVWHKRGPLSVDEWERVRLHAYHSERVLARSPFLAGLAAVATAHHERLDGSGYHRGAAGAALSAPARLLAAADAYHAMTEPRPHREALAPARAAAELAAEARAGRLDAEAVSAVLEAAGQPPLRIERPAGLTEREAQVLGLLARGLQTKEVARALGISPKTADRHVQNAYGKIGVSTRAAAAMFAMEHGLAAWGELPIGAAAARS